MDINIGGTLHSTATNNVVARANEILDTNSNKKQSQINTETNATLAEHDSAITGLNSQNYVSLTAIDTDTTVEGIFTRLGITPAADTVYRVGKWNGATPGYDAAVYSEYSWSNDAYKLLTVISGVDEVFDISQHNLSGDPLAPTKYADLASALGTNGANIPVGIRKGGMSVKFVQSSDNKYVQYYLTKGEWSASEGDWEKINLEEELEEAYKNTLVSEDASELIDSWHVDGSVITFVASDGMNGTFTSHTEPNKPSNTRPYFLFRGFVAGHKYRLQLSVSVNSVNTNKLRFFYANSQTALFSPNQLTDIFGNIADVISGNALDCVFLAESGKTYLGFTADDFGIDETASITDFSITEVFDVVETHDRLDARKLDLNQGYGSFVKEYSLVLLKYLNNNRIAGISGVHYRIRYYNIEQGKIYKVSGYTYSTSGSQLLLVYNGNDEVILSVTGTLGALTKDYTLVAPAGATKIVVAGNTNYQDAELHLVGSNEPDTGLDEYKKRFDVDEKFLGPIYNSLDQALIIRRHISSTTEESATGERLSIIFRVWAGWKVTWQGTFGGGCLGEIHPNPEYCMIGDNNIRLQYISSYTTAQVSGTINYDGYLGFKFKKADGSAFTDQDVQDALDSLSFEISSNGFVQRTDSAIAEVNNAIERLQGGSDYIGLFLGSFVQKALATTGTSSSTDSTHVSMASSVTVPHKEAKVTFILPDDILVEIRSGIKGNELNIDDTGIVSGDTFTFDSNAVYYRLGFSKVSGGDLPVSEIEQLIASGEISISYKQDSNIIDRNAEAEKYVKAMMRTWFAGQTSSESHVMPIFAHTSDVHGDATRLRQFLDYCDYLGIDAALVSGDIVARYPVDSAQYMNDLADSHQSMVLPCVGNHDAYELDSQSQNEQIVGHLMDVGDVVTNPNEDYPTYFYKDFTDKKIRMIALNAYEGGGRITYTTYFSEKQCLWFINALLNTPADYGVLVMYHSLESAVVKENAHSNFFQDYQSYKGYWQGTTNEPVKKIIDAFISKTSLSLTYDTRTYPQTGYEQETITVTADFSNVAEGVEFIAHVTGHEHADGIGLVGGVTNRQVMLNICCGNSIYGIGDSDILARLSDLPREGRGSVQDAFNVYAIDRESGTIRIARVGSNMLPDGIKRDFLMMPYRSN